MEQLQHFSHKHPLSLIQLHLDNINENSDKEDEEDEEDKDENDFVVEKPHVGKCNMCEEEIYSFHLSYYCCKDCDYSLHTFCARLPTTQQNHPLHPDHSLTLSRESQFQDEDFYLTIGSEWGCNLCNVGIERFYNYHCSICKFNMDIICASMSEHKMDHPGHPHQLQRYFRRMMSYCNACGDEHSGIFYNCTTCSWLIHLDCALLPAKLFIQQSTNESFSHSHLLTLTYSFPYTELKAIYFPSCRVCNKDFNIGIWHYRCNKCQYYVHVHCGTSAREAFTSSISMPTGLGKTYKNFKDDDYPNLICYPFPDESVNLLSHLFINKGELVIKGKIDGDMFSHPHPLILVETLLNVTVSLHDPMKKVELLCDGCLRPITHVPFYKCSRHHCGFVLHEWCSRLPFAIQDHHGHPEHTVTTSLKTRSFQDKFPEISRSYPRVQDYKRSC